jgi:hypothetical protein
MFLCYRVEYVYSCLTINRLPDLFAEEPLGCLQLFLHPHPRFSSVTLQLHCTAHWVALLVCFDSFSCHLKKLLFRFYRFVWLQEAAARAPWRSRVRRLRVAHRIAGFQGPLRPLASFRRLGKRSQQLA